jgi:hypothetical protein
MQQQNSKKERMNPSFWAIENCNVLLRVGGDYKTTPAVPISFFPLR